eukprot:Colp12_sorted_trinity150504_noHs@33637
MVFHHNPCKVLYHRLTHLKCGNSSYDAVAAYNYLSDITATSLGYLGTPVPLFELFCIYSCGLPQELSFYYAAILSQVGMDDHTALTEVKTCLLAFVHKLGHTCNQFPNIATGLSILSEVMAYRNCTNTAVAPCTDDTDLDIHSDADDTDAATECKAEDTNVSPLSISGVPESPSIVSPVDLESLNDGTDNVGVSLQSVHTPDDLPIPHVTPEPTPVCSDAESVSAVHESASHNSDASSNTYVSSSGIINLIHLNDPLAPTLLSQPAMISTLVYSDPFAIQLTGSVLIACLTTTFLTLHSGAAPVLDGDPWLHSINHIPAVT